MSLFLQVDNLYIPATDGCHALFAKRIENLRWTSWFCGWITCNDRVPDNILTTHDRTHLPQHPEPQNVQWGVQEVDQQQNKNEPPDYPG